MSEELGGSIEDVLLGEGKEQVSLSPEQVKARQAAATKAMAALKKREKKSKGHDLVLVEILKTMSFNEVRAVATLITAEIGSLIILAVLSPNNEGAKRYCQSLFDKFVQEWADFSDTKAEQVMQKVIGQWWTYIVMADHVTDTGKIGESPLQKDKLWNSLHEVAKMKEFLNQNMYTEKALYYFEEFFPEIVANLEAPEE